MNDRVLEARRGKPARLSFRSITSRDGTVAHHTLDQRDVPKFAKSRTFCSLRRFASVNATLEGHLKMRFDLLICMRQ